MGEGEFDEEDDDDLIILLVSLIYWPTEVSYSPSNIRIYLDISRVLLSFQIPHQSLPLNLVEIDINSSDWSPKSSLI